MRPASQPAPIGDKCGDATSIAVTIGPIGARSFKSSVPAAGGRHDAIHAEIFFHLPIFVKGVNGAKR